MSYRALLSFIWPFIKAQRWSFLFIFLVSLVWSLDATIWPYILRKVIDILTQYDLNRGDAWVALKWVVVAGLFFWLFIEVSFRCMGFVRARAFPKCSADIRMAMFDHIQRHSPKYFSEHFAGNLANKISDMATQIELLFDELLIMLIPAVATCILGVLFFSQLNPLFALILGVWVVIHFAICIFFSRKCSDLEDIHGQARSDLVGKIVDSLTHNFAVNLFYRFGYEKSHIAKFQKEEQLKNSRAKYYVEWMRVSMGMATFLIGCVAINGVMIYLWLQGRLTTGEVAQIFNTTWNIILILWLSGTSIPGIFQAIGIIKQALSVMQDPQDILDEPGANPLLVSKGEILFEGVYFQYGEKKLFQNKGVRIRGGEKVGLVGYSGAGKSTFVNLILRLYPIEIGRILIDGQDIAKVTLQSLREQIALIPQDPQLFHRSLEENIHYGKLEATKEGVVLAARMSHADEFIMRTSQGYDTLVGERGTKLSGGERQRIAIARAMLKEAPLLILDEATSALDSVTEKFIQESLEKLMEGKTTIVIAHRLSTLARMDRILVFDEGKIVEEGSHDALLAKQGHYARMWHMQAGGFLPDTFQSSGV